MFVGSANFPNSLLYVYSVMSLFTNRFLRYEVNHGWVTVHLPILLIQIAMSEYILISSLEPVSPSNSPVFQRYERLKCMFWQLPIHFGGSSSRVGRRAARTGRSDLAGSQLLGWASLAQTTCQ